jgi:hypothetical protein
MPPELPAPGSETNSNVLVQHDDLTNRFRA